MKRENITRVIVAVVAGLLVPSVALAEMVLYLDAREPGDSPTTQWKDLTGNNQPFTPGSYGGAPAPTYNVGSEVYEFGRSAAIHWFECAAEDEDRFDFPAVQYGEPNDPTGAVTIVAYMDNTGYSSNNTFYNKGVGTGPHQWVSVNYEGQDVAYMDVGFNNQPGDRAMSYTTGAGSTSGLQLWVFYFDGSGFGGNFQTYVNGSSTNIAAALPGNSAMSNGSYSGSSSPLHIGSPLGVTNPEGGRFFGDIQFVEVWSGQTCYEGRSPAEYSVWRGNNLGLHPARLPVDCNDAIKKGYGLQTDLDGDCYVKAPDVAMLAEEWLECVVQGDPNCDQPWEDYWGIVVAQDADDAVEYAAEEFQSFIATATGQVLPIVTGATILGQHVFIGDSDALAGSELGSVMDPNYYEEELRIAGSNGNVAIVGGSGRAVLYGVYEFLEEHLGARFVANDVFSVPTTDLQTLFNSLHGVDYTDLPALDAYRHFHWTGTLHAHSDPYDMARLRMNSPDRSSGYDAQKVEDVGGWASSYSTVLHNLFWWVTNNDPYVLPYTITFGSTPECYALYEGSRNSANLCMTHPWVLANAKAKAVEHGPYVSQGTRMQIAQPDTHVHCQCTSSSADGPGDCTSLYNANGGALSATVLNLANDVAQELASEYPTRDLGVASLAYAYSRVPPTNMTAESNVRIQYATYHACMLHGFTDAGCPINVPEAANMTAWNAICDDVFHWHYSVTGKDYLLPPLTLNSVGEQVTDMANWDSRGCFYQGSGGGVGIPFWELNVYLLGRLSWDPSANVNDLIVEFTNAYYGAAAPEIRNFLNDVSTALSGAGGHPNTNGYMNDYGLYESLGVSGITQFENALSLVSGNQTLYDRVEKDSICAYRLALGNAWILSIHPGGDVTPYQGYAAQVDYLGHKYGVNEAGEGLAFDTALGWLSTLLGGW